MEAVSDTEAVKAAGSVTVNVPVTGPQLLSSVTLHGRFDPRLIPVKTPVVLVVPLIVYDSVPVPPDAVMVTVAVSPLHKTGAVTAAEAIIASGSVTSMDPYTGPHPFSSVTL